MLGNRLIRPLDGKATSCSKSISEKTTSCAQVLFFSWSHGLHEEIKFVSRSFKSYVFNAHCRIWSLLRNFENSTRGHAKYLDNVVAFW